MLRRLSAAGLLVGSFALVGCGGGGPTRYHASGKVTFGGKPVARGMVTFDPTGNPGALQGVATITDGVYDTRAGGKGHSGGPYTIRVDAFSGEGATPDAPAGKPLFTNHIEKADLPKADGTRDIEVPEKAATPPTGKGESPTSPPGNVVP